jgi:transcriptional regulator with XRE-family HTH domain
MDWKTIIQELGSHGLTQAQIAAEVGVRQSTIAGILKGDQVDMRWQNGERLRSLHRRVMRKTRSIQASAQAV